MPPWHALGGADGDDDLEHSLRLEVISSLNSKMCAGLSVHAVLAFPYTNEREITLVCSQIKVNYFNRFNLLHDE